MILIVTYTWYDFPKCNAQSKFWTPYLVKNIILTHELEGNYKKKVLVPQDYTDDT